ncbi:circularly permuted type 2 ATP-grasp protein [Kiloniella laminariae]|uniref:Circularly permuted type 2 ATP-grasp protein n=1 Tax=Kiloniella laminariae TaxID=454162 RepID=A0ABT4LHR5_9PROT|nr:circularly permuted type 2 ATP-grasp protein [Kiloniella laminariae]MCZ4279901.1 circularly permuted type 2 ATP-grasp protein [Kiloniella laminariae]
MNFAGYDTQGFYDELFEADGKPRKEALPLIKRINALSSKDLRRRQKAAEHALHQQGITFSVYGDKKGTEKIMPFDILPRIVTAKEWDVLEKGLKQRIRALNLFIDDVYNEQKILKDGVVPEDLVLSSECYLSQCKGLSPPKKIWIHITGTDLVRAGDGEFYVLEDNLRCPSGISYVLQNRTIQKRTLPIVFQAMRTRPVSDYGDHLYETLRHIAPEGVENPNVIVLTPGIYNSAYYEHSFLAQQMGVPLAQGSDLTIIDGHVMLRTTRGFEKVDVIYRRIDDDFLDPEVFNKDSMLGVPGIMECFRKGTVALANAPGTGIADDKAIYAYVPQIIKYYLDEEPVIKNVPTYICEDKKDREYVLANLEKLVVKAVNLSGGYGMLIGPVSTAAERKEFAAKITAAPRDYIAQPTLALSRTPTIVGDNIEGRHVDFRPYILYGKSIFVLPGGLTRVALTKGSLVVNSSQGGGSKDTWVLGDTPIGMEADLDA